MITRYVSCRALHHVASALSTDAFLVGVLHLGRNWPIVCPLAWKYQAGSDILTCAAPALHSAHLLFHRRSSVTTS